MVSSPVNAGNAANCGRKPPRRPLIGIRRDKRESAGRSCGGRMFQAEGTAHAKALRWEAGQGGAQSVWGAGCGRECREGVLL